MRATTLKAIRKHAQEEYPRECCGVLIQAGKKERYIPCRNQAEDKDHFRLSAEDYANAEDEGRIIGIVHSHPDEVDEPSEGDIVGCEASGVAWYIISVTKEGAAKTINKILPVGYSAPLIGRDFSHGTLDCYSIVRDFYSRVMGIELPNYKRQDDWWDKGENLYLDNFTHAGFYQLEEGEPLALGDMIVMEIGATVPNHAGVFIGELEELEGERLFPMHNAFIHHLFGRLSTREVYGGYWAKTTRVILRHKDAKS